MYFGQYFSIFWKQFICLTQHTGVWGWMNLFLEIRHLRFCVCVCMCLINSFGSTLQTIFVSLMKTLAYSYSKPRKRVWQNQAESHLNYEWLAESWLCYERTVKITKKWFRISKYNDKRNNKLFCIKEQLMNTKPRAQPSGYQSQGVAGVKKRLLRHFRFISVLPGKHLATRENCWDDND